MAEEEVKKLLHGAPIPRKCFTQVCMAKMTEAEDTNSILKQLCENGHSFHGLFKRLSSQLFNVMCKNYVRDMNSAIRSKKRGGGESQKLSKSAQKVSKLSSSAIN